MAWTTMHFAVGMGCTGVAATAVCLAVKRGWRWIPAAMTLGGVWALIPDMPRMLREDLPFSHPTLTLISKGLEHHLMRWGDLFFLHRSLDSQPREMALLGMTLILLFYNASVFLLMWLESKQRNSLGNRALRNHAGFRRTRSKYHKHLAADQHPEDQPEQPPCDIVARIHSDNLSRTG